MPSSPETAATERVVDDPATLKVLADPLRLELLDLLAEPKTVKELSASVDRKPDRLYYHLRKLVDAGFVAEVDSHRVGGVTERVWQTTSQRIRVSGASIGPAIAGPLNTKALADIGTGMSAAAGLPTGQGPRSMLGVETIRIPAALREIVTQRLALLLDELARTHPTGSDVDGDDVTIFAGMFVVAEDPA